MSETFFNPAGSINTEFRTLMNMRAVSDPALLALQGKFFMFSHVREGVLDDDIYYYSFTTGVKTVILYQSSFRFAEGPVYVDTVEAPTSFTAGTEYYAPCTYRTKPNSEMLLTAGVTDIVGGYPVQTPEYWPDVGNNVGFAGRVGTIVIIPPGLTGLVKVTNNGGNSNIIRFGIIFAEVDLQDYT